MRILLISLIMILSAAMHAVGQSLSWEEVNAPAPSVSQMFDPEQQTEIIVRDGEIFVRTSCKVTVKVFSILGQLISQKELSPGLHRMKFNSRGVYILRAGTLTRRITL